MEGTSQERHNTLKDIRKELNYSRIDVAKEMKTSEACIERIETGNKNVTLDEAASLSIIYNKPLYEIYKAWIIVKLRKNENVALLKNLP